MSTVPPVLVAIGGRSSHRHRNGRRSQRTGVILRASISEAEVAGNADSENVVDRHAMRKVIA